MSETVETPTPNTDSPTPEQPPPNLPSAGEGTEPVAAESPPPSAEPETPAPAPQPPDWRDKRIATLTRRLREIQERQGQPPEPPRAAAPQQIDQALINQRARELAAIQDFNRRCDEAALTGRAQYGEAEFNSRIQNLQKLSDATDPASVQAYNNLLLAALEAGDSSRLLYELGADLNEAQRILGLTPTKMAVEMTRRAAKVPIQVSNAPKPITPLGGRPAAHERIEPDDPDRSDHLSTREWMRRREAQLADRRKAG